jgi:hypothetical protein
MVSCRRGGAGSLNQRTREKRWCMDGFTIRLRYWILGGVFWFGTCCTASDALAQAQESDRSGRPAASGGRKGGSSGPGKTDARNARAPRGENPAARATEPSAEYQALIRKTVERRRQRRARRQQNAADDVAAVGAIVPWPMPPALIVRHTREVHGEVGSLLYGLRHSP